MKFVLTYFCAFFFLLAMSCDSDDGDDPIVIEEKIPKVSSVTIGEITTDETIVSATISGIDNTRSIDDYGFIYDDAAITNSEQGSRVSLVMPAPLGEFKTVLKDLTPSEHYFVRAYFKTKGEVTLGAENTFTTIGTNSWFSYPVANSPKPPTYEFLGIQLAVNGKGYVGFAEKEIGGDVMSFYEYDPLTRKIKTLKPCPAPFYRYTRRFAQDDNIYLLSSGNTVWRYSITQNSWTQLNNFPGDDNSPRYGFNYDGNGWVIAENDDGDYELWKYDSTTDSWTMESQVDIGSPLFHIAYGVTAINDKIYVIVGLPGGGAPRLVAYNTGTDTYEELEAPPFSVWNGSITDTYWVNAPGGGYFVNMHENEIWNYSVADDNWTKTPSPPSSGNINMFAIDNNLYAISYDLFKYVIE